MAYQLSPGVTWSEIDLTTIVPSVATTEGAFAGNFEWGPIDDVMILNSELDLVRWFHKPTATNFKSFFTAANFLSYTNHLKLVRAANNTSRNATSSSGDQAEVVLIKNQNDYELTSLDLSADAEVGMFAARYAGTLGNGLKVSMCASNNSTSYGSWTYADEFDGVPGTSEYTRTRGGANDELHLIVVDSTGVFSGISNTVLEKFAFISKASDAKNDDGSSNYYVNVINERSQFIYIMNHPQDDTTFVSQTSTWGVPASNVSFTQITDKFTRTLSGGVNVVPTNADLIRAYDTFKNSEEYDISLIMTGDAPQVVSEHIVDNIVGGTSSLPETGRRDAVVFISPPYSAAVNNMGGETGAIITNRNLFNSSSFAVMDSGWKKQFDKYNNVYRWVPLNGDIAGLCARTDYERDPWWSPAGFNRGQIKNSVKLSWTPNKAERDELYKNGINPVVEFKGEGTILYGDKTMLAKPSAFDRINVRRLFIVLEKAITRAAKYSLFEFNDEFTRAQFVALIEPYLRDVKGRRGIYDFKVVCDETNNTPEVIDRNEFIGDIYIKPARSINFIKLNFVAVRTGVAFSEVVGKF